MQIRADSPRYKWILVGILFLAASLNYADRGALTAVFPLLRKDLGMSDLALAAIGSFFLWSYALFSPLAGYLGDRFSRSALVTWSVVAWSVVTALTAFVQTTEQLLAMRVLLGVAESLYIPASLALIAEHHATPTRAMAMSLHLSGFYSGVVFGGTVAGYLGDSYGWRPSLLVLGGVGLLLGLLCKLTVFGLPTEPEHGACVREAARAIIRSQFFKPGENCVVLGVAAGSHAAGYRHLDLCQLAASVFHGNVQDESEWRRFRWNLSGSGRSDDRHSGGRVFFRQSGAKSGAAGECCSTASVTWPRLRCCWPS